MSPPTRGERPADGGLTGRGDEVMRGVLRWARGHWPLAVLLALQTALDVESVNGLPLYSRAWAWPAAVLLAAAALIASRRPVAAAVAASAVLVLWSAVLRLAGVAILGAVGNLMQSEVLALMVIVLVVFRRLPRDRAALILGMLLIACVVANLLRLDPTPFLDDPLPAFVKGPLADLWVPAAVAVALSVAVGWHLRVRDQEQMRTISAAAAAARHRERVSLARELHDVVTHGIGGIVVQADTALAAADARAPERALPLIESAGIDVLSAMRRMVAALRDDSADGGPPPTTTDLRADLHALTAGATDHPPVRLTVDLHQEVPAAVATSVLRVVRESVTNARRHAEQAHRIDVLVRAGDDIVRVLIDDDGRPGRTAARAGGGFGLIGLRERVELLGGTFTAGRTASGGWRVCAELPLRGPSRSAQ